MIAYDLTDTTLVTTDVLVPPPSQAELFAITVALLIHAGRSFSELESTSVTLTVRNRRRIAELIEERMPPLAREFGGPQRLRRRLKQLAGLRISQQLV